MASVTSLDKDMRKLRLDRYTEQSANEVRLYIEEALGERLQPGDLIAALKDGVALCKLVNLAVPNAARFKTKAVMPFVQMENIAIFIETCKKPPFNLQSHDIFLTVDLYESKDPAQVLQCIGAFSRAANRINPTAFPSSIGGKSARPGVSSPQGAGFGGGSYHGARGASNASNGSSTFNPINRPTTLTPTRTGDSNSGRWSPTKSPTPTSGGGVSSWSNRTDEGVTSPAWNIAQYGYMGGASQGNLGVQFGGRRQLTSAGPAVPSLAEKQKQRREREAEEERLKQQAEEDERKRQQEEEEKARLAEEARWANETKKLREQETQRVEEEKRRWEEEERQWRQQEDQRRREEEETELRLQEERKRARGNSDARLRGQFLSQYQAENTAKPKVENGESSRIKELERQLEEARERERRYEEERQSRPRPAESNNQWLPPPKEDKIRPRSRSRPRLGERSASRNTQDQQSQLDERDFLQQQWQNQQTIDDTPAPIPSKSPRPLPEPTLPPRIPKQHTGSRPLPEPNVPPRIPKQHTGSRPLPDPANYSKTAQRTPAPTQLSDTTIPPRSQNQSRTDQFLSSNPALAQSAPRTTYSNELGSFDSGAERDAEDRRRVQSQQKTKAGGWASKSLLEREMEMERERQREWEESQKETAVRKADPAKGVDGLGGGIGGKWDVNQWTGYTGGDGQNKGNLGIGVGRRQIGGPRPPPGR